VARYRPEADLNSVHKAPGTPNNLLMGKEMNSQEEKRFSFSTCMFIKPN